MAYYEELPEYELSYEETFGILRRKVAVVAELILMAALAPHFYVQGLHRLMQLVHIRLP